MQKPDTLGALLAAARQRLAGADIETPVLDARLLLQEAAQVSHATVIAEPEQVVAKQVARIFAGYVERRMALEPVSRILGRREFYGREFKVTADVLDPRPDTETLVDLCLAHMRSVPAARIVDLGTGSGVILVTLLAELSRAHGVATDISPAALAVAKDNAKHHGVSQRMTTFAGSWLSGVSGTFDLIVSNPPYIPMAEIPALEVEVRDHDPHLALAGGLDGLDCYRAIASGALRHLNPDGLVIAEIGAGQMADVGAIFAASGLAVADSRTDLGGHVRALAFRACPDEVA